MTEPRTPLISIVDDEELARDGICLLVESFGYEAISFPSAEHFLQSDVMAKTTCLITDVQMPGLNGLELQEALQSLGNQTPVIVITGYPNQKHRTRALENGAVAYLSKPFTDRSLMECLTEAIKLSFRCFGEAIMNEEAFNVSMRKFLKKVGITSQREIENAVRAALINGKLKGHEALPAKVILTVGAVGLAVEIDGAVELE